MEIPLEIGVAGKITSSPRQFAPLRTTRRPESAPDLDALTSDVADNNQHQDHSRKVGGMQDSMVRTLNYAQ